MTPIEPSDRARFEALFRAHYRDVHRFALRRTDPATAEDVTNETFAACWRTLEKVPAEPLPWLFAVARNGIANHRRAAARSAEKTRRVGVEAPATGRDPAERFAARDVILRAFGTLSERDREALRLTAWDGLSMVDAARAAGVSRAGFAMRLHRARRRLAARLDELEDGSATEPLPLESAL
jgi:RNA polymerase sigma-70 factor (ECF subfamily)